MCLTSVQIMTCSASKRKRSLITTTFLVRILQKDEGLFGNNVTRHLSREQFLLEKHMTALFLPRSKTLLSTPTFSMLSQAVDILLVRQNGELFQGCLNFADEFVAKAKTKAQSSSQYTLVLSADFVGTKMSLKFQRKKG